MAGSVRCAGTRASGERSRIVMSRVLAELAFEYLCRSARVDSWLPTRCPRNGMRTTSVGGRAIRTRSPISQAVPSSATVARTRGWHGQAHPSSRLEVRPCGGSRAGRRHASPARRSVVLRVRRWTAARNRSRSRPTQSTRSLSPPGLPLVRQRSRPDRDRTRPATARCTRRDVERAARAGRAVDHCCRRAARPDLATRLRFPARHDESTAGRPALGSSPSPK